MARGITKEQVFEAAAALATEGRSPSVQLVRQRLGSGSFSTITAHLRAWTNEFGEKAVAQIPELPESISAASQQFWAAAWRAAQEGVGAEREGLAALRRELEVERGEMLLEIEELQKKLETSEKEASTLRSELLIKEDACSALEAEVNSLKLRNARHEERETAAREIVSERDATIARLEERLDKIATAGLSKSSALES